MTNTSGIIAGMNPLEYDSAAPYTIFLIQAVIIIVISQLLFIPLSYIKQPRVIAEVLTGIVLGHTALGRIPNFTEYVLPSGSIPGLTLMANVGICFLLFMVGCEVDVQFIRKHLVTALTVGIFNMAVPFGLGCALAVGLWNDYRLNVADLPEIKFTTFMVFIAVAMCITAFPVLARILTELRLVKDRVGVVVLAAGITNDLLGWILLALSITLANSTKSEVTAYIVLVTIGWCLFVVFPVRWCLNYVLDNILKDVDNPDGPSRFSMMIILVSMFCSAFFTDIIGVHPIFGAFILGTIVPRKNNYVIKLTDRIEDLVNIIFVPIYFAIAGLNVDLGLLNKGLDWAWTIGLIGVAMVAKVFGGMIAAKLHGLYWRESLSVGVLMSCKGIVEIVVLQTGLNAKIITQKTYSMFILMALVTTFFTTPLTLYCYPESYREKVQVWLQEKEKRELEKNSQNKSVENIDEIKDEEQTGAEEIIIGGSEEDESTDYGNNPKFVRAKTLKYEDIKFDKLILSIDDVESVSNNLILLDNISSPSKLPIHAINIKKLTDRTADILHASMWKENHEIEFNSLNSILSILKIFCDFNKIPFTSEILFSLPETMSQTLLENPIYTKDNLLILTIPHRNYSTNLIGDLLNRSKEGQSYKAIFINNNQDIKADVIKEDSEDLSELKTFYSGETILNPLSFKISSITLVVNNSTLSRQDMVAFKIFSIMVNHRDIHLGRVIITQSSSSNVCQMITDRIAHLNIDHSQVDIIIEDKSNELRNVETGVSTFKEFVHSWNKTEYSSVDELVITPINSVFGIDLISKLVEENEKVLVVF